MPFEWLLLADSSTETVTSVPSQILRLVRYADTSYEAPDEVSALEESGSRGYKVLLEGLQTGVAFISAKIKDPSYRDVSETRVKLRVVANVQMLPGEVYLMPLASAAIRAYMFRQNRPTPLQLPSNQYSAFVGDKQIASYDEKSSLVKAVNFGSTNVTLIDKNIQIKDDYIPPASFIYVEKPASLRMTLVQYPHASSPWILESGLTYEVHIEVLDRMGHSLILPQGFKINCEWSSEHFNIQTQSDNGTFWVIDAKTFGEGSIPSFANWEFKNEKVKLEISQDYIIYPPITVHPKNFALPLATFSEDFIGQKLHVTGGSGNYVFMSADNKVVTVDAHGLVKSVATEPGATEIKVFDQLNHKHSATAHVVVGDIIEIEFSPDSKTEALIGSRLEVGIRAFVERNNRLVQVANCSALRFSVDLLKMTLQETSDSEDHNDVFRFVNIVGPNVAETKSLHCAIVVLDTLRAGFTDLRLTSPKTASTIISGYSPLRLHTIPRYDSEDIVTAVGTSIRLPVIGGPLVWPNERDKHDVSVEKKEQAQIEHHFTWNSKEIEVTVECKSAGDVQLLLTAGNKRLNPNNVMETLAINVGCVHPHSIAISIPWGHGTVSQPACPATLDSTIPFPVTINDVFPIEVKVFDAKQRRLLNISSFSWKWSFQQSKIDRNGKEDESSLTYDKQNNRFAHDFKSLQLGDESVSVELTGYKKNIFQLGSKIKSSLLLKVVNPGKLSETDVFLFTLPAATKKIYVYEGSGYFQFNIKDKNLVNDRMASTIQSDYQTLTISPHGNGYFKVEAIDLCARPGSPTQSQLLVNVKVLSIDRLQVIGRRFVELGDSYQIGVVAMDATGNHFLPADMYHTLKLRPEYPEAKISVTPVDFHGEIAVFSVTGKETGLAKLVFTTTGVADHIVSEDYSVEVCNKVAIQPSPKLILMDGAVYQLSIRGGPLLITPKPSVSFRFKGAKDVVSLDTSSGLLTANKKLGQTKIEAVLFDTDPLMKYLGKGENSMFEIITKPLLVETRNLKDIYLSSPSTRIHVNTVMPITVFGYTEDDQQRQTLEFNPAGFGTANPGLQYTWQVSPTGPNIELLSPLSGPFYSKPLLEDFTVYFRTSTPGDFVVTVNVIRPGQTGFQNLTAVLPISVSLPFEIEGVRRPFTVTVGSEMHLPVTGCSKGAKYIQRSVNTSSSIPTAMVSSVQNSFIAKTPGRSHFVAECTSSEFLSFSFDVLQHFTYTTIQFPENLRVSKIGKQISGLPYGSSINLDVNYFTRQGRNFDAVSGDFECTLNRKDAVTFYLASGTPKTATADLSVVDSNSVVWCESANAFPLFLSISVKPSLTPFGQSVDVGDVICFQSLTNDQQKWSTSDSDNVYIDENSGVAVALRSSTKEIVASTSKEGYRQSSPLTIKPLQRFSFTKKSNNLLVISDSQFNSSLLLNLELEDALHRRPTVVGQCPVNIRLPVGFPTPVQCDIQAPENVIRHFSVKTSFEILQSPVNQVDYKCDLKFTGGNFMMDPGYEFPIRVYATLNSIGERESTEIYFVPTPRLSTSSLSLDGATLSANLTITASEKAFRSLVVQPSHGSFISITGPLPLSGESNTYLYEVAIPTHRKVPANLIEKLSVNVKIPLLNHERVIRVVLPPKASTGPAMDESNLLTHLFGATSPSVIIAYVVAAVLLLLLIAQLTLRGGLFGQPNFVQTVYTYGMLRLFNFSNASQWD